ncbi:MAG: pteridine reductase [Candidatus Muproteobacteria bacterium RBG_16_64_11]|uniref:Pteridine reductase n=1 Tax=Candidatus Muproteobacteria bacterium RBG_16_64_11 TaxID=1817758 RepID=A0A1F6TI63_9PROT|nr:MAG: pteridine reductase [Candidatus Muproteobacteria bacterium RBG_16_64_11]
MAGKVALVTGGVRRIGAAVCRALHAQGMNLVIHYRSSEKDAHALQAELHAIRPESVMLVRGDLLNAAKLGNLVYETVDSFERLDVLINNASSFYPTPVGEATEKQWDDLIGSNLKAPFFLSQAAAPHLKKTHGCIVNMVDIHAERPLRSYPVYCAAKAGLAMLTKSLARELAPEVRVNGVAPGTILWPEIDLDELTKQRIISRVPLKRSGDPDDIARTILFLVRDAGYITGQVIAVDGGRSVVG